MDAGDLLRSMYFLLAQSVQGDYGKILEYIEPPDACLMVDFDSEEKSAEREAYEIEICKAMRLTSTVELNQWLAGLYNGRFWSEGWDPEPEL